jgi:hypothetical protein
VKNLHDSGAGSLRAAVEYANSHPNSTINFAGLLSGTIKLTSGELAITQSTTIDGPGAGKLAVSGTSHSRVFAISPGTTVTMSGLTITRGLADSDASEIKGFGGGILNQGDLTLEDTIVSHNQATGAASDTISLSGYVLTGAGGGGGVANLGMLTVSHSGFVGNEARGACGSSDAGGSPFPGVAVGGGLFNVGKATATVTRCWFTGNLAQAGDGGLSTGPGGIAGDAGGGAIASFGFSPPPPGLKNLATLGVSHSHFSKNQAIGGNDNQSPLLPGHAFGGAVASHRFNGSAELSVSHSTFDQNQAVGGNHNVVTAAGQGNPRGVPNLASAGGVFACGKGTIRESTFDQNEAIGGQGVAGTVGIPIMKNGGDGRGGGIGVAFSGTDVTVGQCTVKHNLAVGGQAGAGGSGGGAWGGGVSNAQAEAKLTITDSIIDGNRARGGRAHTSGPLSHGGDGLGGGIYQGSGAGSKTTLTACSITHNRARGGQGKHGGSDGQGVGGGLYNSGTVAVDPATVIHKNHASTNNNNVYP